MSWIHFSEERRAVLRIVAAYGIFGSLWIYLSDSALGLLVHDPHTMTVIATYKGLMFIVLTSLLLYVLISRYVDSIQEKKRLLNISEERFQSIFHGVSEAVFIHSLSGKILKVNRTAGEMFGYSADELVALDVDSISLGTPPYSQQEAVAWLTRAADAPQKFEWQCRRKDGGLFWTEIRMRAATVSDEPHIIVSVRDIADRKQADLLLQQHHAMLENLSQQVPGVLFQTFIAPDGNSCTPYASDKLHDIYELSPQDILASTAPIIERFHPEDRERILNSIVAAVAEHTTWECEYRVVLPRQGVKWLYGTAQVQGLPDGSAVLYGIIMDITERKRAEDLLRLSEEKFATAFRATPDAVNLTRMSDGAYLEVNEGFVAITGYTQEEVIGKSSLELSIWVDPEDRARLVRGLAENGIVRNLEAEFRRKDGSTLIGHMSACFIDLGGEKFILSITRDITEQVNSQKELLKIQKLESLGVLAGGIAHDFNNLLTGIMGNISFARMFLDDTHRSFAILQEAEKASQRATDLAHQLLTFAKGGEPVKQAIQVQKVVEASASLALRGSNVQCLFDIPLNLAAIDGDEGQINQVFNNLFINAAQAMPGGGTVKVSADMAVIESENLLLLPPGNYVRCVITDSGCGISEEAQKRIFDPYFTTKAGGNGLGLASVYSIITRHGGHISVMSVPNAGATFTLFLPASSEQVATVSLENHVTAPAGVAGNVSLPVLVMDDEEMIRIMVAEMLVELGYSVQVCADGNEAIALYADALGKNSPFRGVIMDLTIPGGMGGKEAAVKILEIDPAARLIVSSGYSNDPVVADYRSYGFCASVVKPYTMSGLATVLQNQLS
jgi:PAS domain S-box-containing protein